MATTDLGHYAVCCKVVLVKRSNEECLCGVIIQGLMDLLVWLCATEKCYYLSFWNKGGPAPSPL